MFPVYRSWWASETIEALNLGYWIVFWDNELALNIIFSTNLAKLCLNLRMFLKFLNIFVLFCVQRSLLANETFLVLAKRLHERNAETKKGFKRSFTAKCKNFPFEFWTFILFLYYLIINKARKLEVAESNIIMEKIPLSLSVGDSFFLFLVHVLSLALSLSLSLPLSLSLSFLNSFVDTALMRHDVIIYYPHLRPLRLS